MQVQRRLELEARQLEATENQPSVGPIVVPAPHEPTPEERAAHEVLHMPPADWCLACQLGNATSKPHHKLTYERQDIGKARARMDFAFMKTSGEFAEPGEVPPQAERFSTTLVAVDRDTHMMKVFR